MAGGFRRRPILVTGVHRSGTTWVGKMLALSPRVASVGEVFDFNPSHPLAQRGFPQWPYAYVTEENQDRYVQGIEDVLQFKVGYRSARFGGLLQRNLLYRWTHRMFSLPRPLLKDPLAAFAAEWLADRFNMQVVVLVRHPAAVVSSLMRVNWRFDFDLFLKQKRLMEDWLSPFEEQIRAKPTDFIEEASLLWLCVYHVLDRHMQMYPEWILKRHEDLCQATIEEFADLYQRVGIPFTRHAASMIGAYSASRNPVDAPAGVEHHLKRDSRSLIKRWKRTLSVAEVDRIRKIVAGLASRFYGEKDW